MLGSILFGAVVFMAAQGTVCAQSGAAEATPSPDEIIRKFAAKELEFRKARENYTYTQILKMEELDSSGAPEGKWEETTDVTFGPNKQRMEHVTHAPPISLVHITLDPQDLQDLRDVQPFVLTSEDIGKYDVEYLGKQNVDEIPCYQFSVKPKKLVKGERYFQGTIWVDDRDFQIVKTFGKNVPDLVKLKKGQQNLFPRFTTWREQIDGKYWFPTYTKVDDNLHFEMGDVHIRQVVKYENYRRFGSKSRILFEREEVKGADDGPKNDGQKNDKK